MNDAFTVRHQIRRFPLWVLILIKCHFRISGVTGFEGIFSGVLIRSSSLFASSQLCRRKRV